MIYDPIRERFRAKDSLQTVMRLRSEKPKVSWPEFVKEAPELVDVLQNLQESPSVLTLIEQVVVMSYQYIWMHPETALFHKGFWLNWALKLVIR